MTGLVRADTELMLVAAEEMHRVGTLMLEQFAGVERAMQAMQNSWWHGRNRDVIEERWWALFEQFEPAAAALLELAVRLKRTATALDAAALLFGESVAMPGSEKTPSYLSWLLKMLEPEASRNLGLLPTDPLTTLNLLFSTPMGRALLKVAQEAYAQGKPVLDTRIPVDGPPPRIYIINGIDSDAAVGAPDESALFLERKLEELGYNPQDVHATAAVYNTNLDTQLEGTNFGGWLSPIDLETSKYASSLNVFSDVGNIMLGGVQVAGEYVLGENGYYTQQTIASIKQDLAAHPLLPGQEVVLISHSGGGAIAPSVAQALQRDNITTAGIVTMGSPVSNVETASQYARQVVELRDQYDYIGLPAVRSSEGRAQHLALLSGLLPLGTALAAEARNRSVHPNMTRVTTNSGERGTISAHTSYWNSQEVVRTISTHFPAVGRALQRQPQRRTKS